MPLNTCLGHGLFIRLLERVGPVYDNVAAKHAACAESFLGSCSRFVTVKVQERKPTILLFWIVRNVVDNNILQAI